MKVPAPENPFWLSSPSAWFDPSALGIPAEKAGSLMFNAGAKGFYRVNYDAGGRSDVEE